MAIYRLALRVVSRGMGGSAIAAAAYQAGTRLVDEREGWTYNFRWRSGVLHTELIGADGRTRQQLWREAVAAERRWDAVEAREIIVALPHELSYTQRRELALELTHWLRARYGVAVDVATHRPSTDPRNHHAHLLFTTRSVTGEGFARRKVRELDDFRTSRRELLRIREKWADLVNLALERAGREERVSHLANEVLEGEDRLPARHLGRYAMERERAGEATHVGDYNRDVERVNQIRELLGPEYGQVDPAQPFPRSEAELSRDHAALQALILEMVGLQRAEKEGKVRLSFEQRRRLEALLKEMRDVLAGLRKELDVFSQERIRQRQLAKQTVRGRGLGWER